MNTSSFKRFLDRSISGEATNLIAEGVVIDGFIKGIGHLIVAGRVKGDCKISGTVTLTETGSWQGNIDAVKVLIAGRLEGSARADEKLEIALSAKIEGDVTAKSIAVAKGAIVNGNMHVESGDAPVRFKEKRKNPEPKDTSA